MADYTHNSGCQQRDVVRAVSVRDEAKDGSADKRDQLRDARQFCHRQLDPSDLPCLRLTCGQHVSSTTLSLRLVVPLVRVPFTEARGDEVGFDDQRDEQGDSNRRSPIVISAVSTL